MKKLFLISLFFNFTTSGFSQTTTYLSNCMMVVNPNGADYGNNKMKIIVTEPKAGQTGSVKVIAIKENSSGTFKIKLLKTVTDQYSTIIWYAVVDNEMYNIFKLCKYKEAISCEKDYYKINLVLSKYDSDNMPVKELALLSTISN